MPRLIIHPVWSESSLGAQPHCWFCHVAAHLITSGELHCGAETCENDQGCADIASSYRGGQCMQPYGKETKHCCLLAMTSQQRPGDHYAGLLLFNPYKPSVPFLGHGQTVQTQIRRRRTQRLIRVFTVCSQEFIFEIEYKWKKYT